MPQFLEIDGVRYADVLDCQTSDELAESDVQTFADAATGGARQFFLNITAVQSTAVGSFWDYMWDNEGTVVAFRYARHGNDVPTADQPHLTGTARVGHVPSIGGVGSFVTVWAIEGTPALVDGPE